MIEGNPCKYCGKIPRVVNVPGDLYYATCTCGKWNPYEFCGSTPARTIDNWNTYNLKKGEKRKLEDQIIQEHIAAN